MSDIAAGPGGILIDPSQERGYRRTAQLQEAFDSASSQLFAADSVPDPQQGGKRQLVADLALEGGGVKGIGLVGAVLVLEEAGYSFRGVAGTSAGAIAASLIASLSKAGRSMIGLKQYMETLDFTKFMPEGKIHAFLDHHGGKAGTMIADTAILSHKLGLYNGDYLLEWLGPILHDDLGVKSFADLKLTLQDDPGMSLPPGHEYRMVVHTSDVTRACLVRLPWDYHIYGHDAEGEDVVAAARASMSIPFFFEPVCFEASPAVVDVPSPGGGVVTQRYEGGTVSWVDGGMLRNFPISAFDRADGNPPRWPTIGIKLSALPTNFSVTSACESSMAVGIRCMRAALNEWDTYNVDATTAGRTVFVDSAGLTATDFDLTLEQQQTLLANGVRAATNFIIEMAQAGGVPRTPEAARAHVLARAGTAASTT
jgi:NTE family protein